MKPNDRRQASPIEYRQRVFTALGCTPAGHPPNWLSVAASRRILADFKPMCLFTVGSWLCPHGVAGGRISLRPQRARKNPAWRCDSWPFCLKNRCLRRDLLGILQEAEKLSFTVYPSAPSDALDAGGKPETLRFLAINRFCWFWRQQRRTLHQPRRTQISPPADKYRCCNVSGSLDWAESGTPQPCA